MHRVCQYGLVRNPATRQLLRLCVQQDGAADLSCCAHPDDSAVNVANVRAAVLVYYQTLAGEALHSEYVQCSYGANNIIANDTKVPAGYALTGPRIVTVNVTKQRRHPLVRYIHLLVNLRADTATQLFHKPHPVCLSTDIL